MGDGGRKFWLSMVKPGNCSSPDQQLFLGLNAKQYVVVFSRSKKKIPEHISPSLLASIFHLLIDYLNGF